MRWKSGFPFPSFKKVILLLSLTSMSCLTAGCWDRRELNDTAFILATAVDLEPNGRIRVTSEIPIISKTGSGGGEGGGGGEESTYFISETGASVRDAIAVMQRRVPRFLSSAHRKIFVIGEDLARRGIRPIFDVAARLPETRLNGNILIAKGKAYELLQASAPLETYSAEALREEARTNGQRLANIKNAAQAVTSVSSDPAIVYVETVKNKFQKKTQTEFRVAGFARFREDKMIGTFNPLSVEGLAWLKQQFEPEEHSFQFAGEDIAVFNLLQGHTQIEPVLLPGGRLRFDIRMIIRVAFTEFHTTREITTPMEARTLRMKTTEYVKNLVDGTLIEMQEEGTDNVGFGEYVWNRYPRQWKDRFEKNWRSEFKRAQMNVSVQVNVAQTGLISSNPANEERIK